MGSTRLPGKVLMHVLDKPLIAYQLERLKEAKLANGINLLTSTNPEDDILEKLCERWEVPCFRGSPDDVLCRYYLAAQQDHPDAIVRVTGDCPLIDPDIVDEVIACFQTDRSYDYVSNSLERSFPRGLDTEIMTFEALEKAHRFGLKQPEREHVTPYIYHHPEQFKLGNVLQIPDLSHHRWTVDTIEDFELIQRIIEELYPANPHFRMDDVVALLDKHPDWMKINADVKQKAVWTKQP